MQYLGAGAFQPGIIQAPAATFLLFKVMAVRAALVYFILGLSHFADPPPPSPRQAIGPQNAIILVFNVNQLTRSSFNKF